MSATFKTDARIMIHLAPVGRPCGESLFMRWKAAIPNMCGNAFGKVIPSFSAPYFIAESSDMVGMDAAVTKTFMDDLAAQGFTVIIPV